MLDKRSSLRLLLCVCCFTGHVFGVDTYFTGEGGTRAWENPANWTDGLVAAGSDLANINASCDIGSGITASCSSLQMATDALAIELTVLSNGILHVGNECNISTDPDGNSNAAFNVIDNAIVTAGVKIRIGDYGMATGYIGDNASVTAGMLIVGTYDDANGILTIDGGTLTTTDAGAHLWLGYSNTADTNPATGTLTVNGGVVNTAGGMLVGTFGNGIFNVNGGETNVATNFYIGYGDFSTGQMTVTDGTVNVLNAFHLGENGTGLLNMDGGTINIGGAAYSNFVIGLGGGAGTLVMRDGTINLNAPLYVGYASSGEGHINLQGGTLNVNNLGFTVNELSRIDFSGGTLVLAGDRRMLINDYIAEGLVTAWNGDRTVSVVYNGQTGKTIVTADADSLNAAWNPTPADKGILAGADKNNAEARILWFNGDQASQHDVYFGSSFEEVNNADNSLPPGSSVYKGRQDPNSYDPGTALQMGETYYWRVDEVASDGTTIWQGPVWQFAVSDFVLVDDFESYNNTTELQTVWTGAATLEATIRNDTKSLKFAGADFVAKSLSFKNWTSYGIEAIEIAYHGDSLNTGIAQEMYVTLEDGTNNSTVSFDGYPDSLEQDDWQPFKLWNVDLTEFSGIDFSNITKIIIGTTSTDIIYVDDIRLYIPRCLPEKTIADLNGDCDVDFDDFLLLATDWLGGNDTITGVNPGSAGLRVWYKFNETNPYLQPADSSGNGYNGTIGSGKLAVWDIGGYDAGCLVFQGTYGVIVPPAAVGSVTDAVTVSVWVYGDASHPRSDSPVLFHGNKLGVDRILLSYCPGPYGSVEFHSGNDPLHLPYPFNISSYQAQLSSEFKGQWNHYAFVKDVSSGVQRIYLNGLLKAETLNATASLDGMTAFAVGSTVSGGDGSYYGKMDDFKIYNRALSQAEIVYLAGETSVEQPLLSQADTNEDDVVDLEDFAEVAPMWLEMNAVWPF